MFKHLKAFGVFMREQGVAGLAIGFALGGSTNKVITSLVADIIQPAIGLLFGSVDILTELKYEEIAYGSFLLNIIDFIIVAFVVYFFFRVMNLQKLDMAKSSAKDDDKK